MHACLNAVCVYGGGVHGVCVYSVHAEVVGGVWCVCVCVYVCGVHAVCVLCVVHVCVRKCVWCARVCVCVRGVCTP